MAKFSERLRELRLDKEISQHQLAKLTGISQMPLLFGKMRKEPLIQML